jgi:hypothetical protein
MKGFPGAIELFNLPAVQLIDELPFVVSFKIDEMAVHGLYVAKSFGFAYSFFGEFAIAPAPRR